MPPKRTVPASVPLYDDAYITEQVNYQSGLQSDLVSGGYVDLRTFRTKQKEDALMSGMTEEQYAEEYEKPIYEPTDTKTHPEHRGYGYHFYGSGEIDRFIKENRTRNRDIVDRMYEKGADVMISPMDRDILKLSNTAIRNALNDPSQFQIVSRDTGSGGSENMLIAQDYSKQDSRPRIRIGGRLYDAQRVLGIANERDSLRTVFYNTPTGITREGLTGRHTRYPKRQVNPNGFVLGTPSDNTKDDLHQSDWLKEISGGGSGEYTSPMNNKITIPSASQFKINDLRKFEYEAREGFPSVDSAGNVTHSPMNLVRQGSRFVVDFSGARMPKLIGKKVNDTNRIQSAQEYLQTAWDTPPLLQQVSGQDYTHLATGNIISNVSIGSSENRRNTIEAMLNDRDAFMSAQTSAAPAPPAASAIATAAPGAATATVAAAAGAATAGPPPTPSGPINLRLKPRVPVNLRFKNTAPSRASAAAVTRPLINLKWKKP